MKKRIEFNGLVYEKDFLNDFRPPKTHWDNELQKEVKSPHYHEGNAVIDVGACTPCNDRRVQVRVTVELMNEGIIQVG